MGITVDSQLIEGGLFLDQTKELALEGEWKNVEVVICVVMMRPNVEFSRANPMGCFQAGQDR
jgi:hypothetical protein